MGGGIGTQFINFISNLLISRMLGATEYGNLSVLLGVLLIATQLSDYGLSTSIPKVASGYREKLTEVARRLMLLKLKLLLVFSVFLSLWLYEVERIGVNLIIYFVISMWIASYYSIVIAFCNAQKEFYFISIINVLTQGLKLLFVFLLYFDLFEVSFENILIGYFLPQLLFVCLFFIKNFDWLTYESIDKKNSDYDSIICISKWFFVSSIAVAIMMRIDVIMLKHLDSSMSAGLYSVANQITLAFAFLTSAVNQVLLPNISDYIKDKGVKRYRDKVLGFWFLIPVFSALISLVSYFVINFYGEEFDGAYYPLLLLSFSYSIGIISNPLSLIFIEKNGSGKLTLLNYIQLALNVIGNFLLIPIFGLIGAAISTMIVRVAGSFYIVVFSRRYV